MKKNKGKSEELLFQALHGRADVLNLIGKNEEALKDTHLAINKSIKLCDDGNTAKGLHQASTIYSKLSEFRKMRTYAEKALRIYSAINDNKGKSEVISYIGEYYLMIGKFDKAREYYSRSLKLISKNNQSAEYANQLNNLAIFYSDHIGDYTKAIKIQKEVLVIAKKKGYRQLEGASLNNMGSIYHRQGDLKKALEYNHKSINIIESIGDKEGIATILNNIGVLNFFAGDHEEAVEIFNKSLKIREQIGDLRGVSICLNNIGFIYEDKKEFEKSFAAYTKALHLREKIGDRLGQAETLNNISNYFKDTGKYEKALEAVNASIIIRKEIGDSRGIYICFRRKGEIYRCMKKYVEALAIYKEHEKHLKQEGNTDEVKALYDTLGFLSYKSGYLKESMNYHRRLLRLKDTTDEKKIEIYERICTISLLTGNLRQLEKYSGVLSGKGKHDWETEADIARYIKTRSNEHFKKTHKRNKQTVKTSGLGIKIQVLDAKRLFIAGKIIEAGKIVDEGLNALISDRDMQAAGEMLLNYCMFLKNIGDIQYVQFKKRASAIFSKAGLHEWAKICANI